MWSSLVKDRKSQFILVVFVFYSLWWVYLQFLPLRIKESFDLFSDTYGIMAWMGGLWGLSVASQWGGVKSTVGRAIVVLSIGLILQAFGQFTYSYYHLFMGIDVPYPSIGDVGFFGSIPFYIYGAFLLGRAAGVRYQPRVFFRKPEALIIPIMMIFGVYYFFLRHYQFDYDMIKAVLDIGYPLFEAVYISIVILVYMQSQRTLGGIMRNRVLLILMAFFLQFLSDFVFLYKANYNIWFSGGINDYMYFCSYTLMTLGLLQFNTVLTKIKGK